MYKSTCIPVAEQIVDIKGESANGHERCDDTMAGTQIVKYIHVVTGEEKSGKVVPCTYIHAIIKPQHTLNEP